VILHEFDLNSDEPAHVVDVDDDGDAGDANFVGQTFTDAAHGIEVSVDAATATGYSSIVLNRYPLPVHVRSIGVRFQSSRGRYLVKAGVRVADADNLPVPGSTVSAV
jgi:hypothetical protein